MAEKQTDTQGCEELRIALVMNGGVSLAVWMGGVTNEIFCLVKRKHPVYQMLLDMTRTTVRVDVISGTSAGGINGAALTLALLYDGDFTALRKVWLSTGAFGDLLRPVLGKNPGSLLMGDEFFLPHIEDAFKAMAKCDQTQVSVADTSIDLRLTTTLLTGRRGKTVDDLGVEINDVDYRAHFHFLHTGERDDFRDRDQVIALLARAARSSVSFPFAFEPSFISETSGLDEHLRDSCDRKLGTPRFVVDGGLLDNKPFKGALQATFGMERRSCVRRVLAYVNPDPGDGPPGNPGQKMPPVGVVVAESILGIPQSQSISDQLDEIREHNETVRTRRDSVVTLVRCLGNNDFDQLPGRLFNVYRERRLADTFEQFVYSALPRAAADNAGLADGLRAIGKHGREQLKAIFMTVDWHEWIPRAWPTTPQDESNRIDTWAWGLFPVEFAAKVMLDILRKAQDLLDYTLPPPESAAATANRECRAVRFAEWSDGSTASDLPGITTHAAATAYVTRDELGEDWDRDVGASCSANPPPYAGELPSLWARAYEQVGKLTSRRRCERETWDTNTKALLDKLGKKAKGEGSSAGTILDKPDFEEMFRFLGQNGRPQECARFALAIAGIVNETSKIAIGIAERSLQSGRLRQPDRDEAKALLALGLHLFVERDASAPDDDCAQQVLFKLLQIEVIEFAFNAHASLDSDTVIELAQISGDSSSPLGGPAKAKCKLLGLQLAHFGAFYKRSWRANDWAFGRLDGAERLIRLLLNPERLHRFYFGRLSEAAAQIEEIALGSITSDVLREEVGRVWDAEEYRRRILQELGFLDSLDARLPDALPVCAQALTTRLHFAILRDELPELTSAIAADQAQGADVAGPSDALLRDLAADGERAGVPARPFSPEQARKCLERGLIAQERLEDEAGSDLFTRTLTHSAATLQNLLASKTAKLGPVSTLFASLKVPILGFYFVAQGLTHQSKTSAALNGGILAAGAALVCFALLNRPSPPPGLLVTLAWTMLAYGLLASIVRAPRTVGLVVWLLLVVAAIATKGLVLGALALAATLLTLSVVNERLQWLQWLIGFLVIGVAGAWEGGWLDVRPGPSDDRVHILVLAGVVCLGLLLAIWEALPISAKAEHWVRIRLKYLLPREGQAANRRHATCNRGEESTKNAGASAELR